MISTVTTTTVTTVTTVAMAGSLGIISILTLLVLLVQKEVSATSDGRVGQSLGRMLNIGIVPLLIGFALIVAVNVMEALR